MYDVSQAKNLLYLHHEQIKICLHLIQMKQWRDFWGIQDVSWMREWPDMMSNTLSRQPHHLTKYESVHNKRDTKKVTFNRLLRDRSINLIWFSKKSIKGNFWLVIHHELELDSMSYLIFLCEINFVWSCF